MASSSSSPTPPSASAMFRVQGGQRWLVVALLASLVLWNVPYGWVALYPFKLFATWLHESAHGVMMLATGAGLAELEIFRDTSGLAHAARGVGPTAQALVSSAGYIGTALFGAFFLVLGRSERGGRVVLLLLAGCMAASVVAAVRNLFGATAIGVEAAALAMVGLWGGERLAAFVVSLLAAQSCINAVLDIRVLFGSTRIVDGRPYSASDADTVASVVGGPAWLWAALWLLWSFFMFYLALRLIRPRAAERAATTPMAA